MILFRWRAPTKKRVPTPLPSPLPPCSRRATVPARTSPRSANPSHRVHRRHHLRRIHNFARSLPNRPLSRSLFPSEVRFPSSSPSSPVFSSYQVRHEALPVPGGIDFVVHVATWPPRHVAVRASLVLPPHPPPPSSTATYSGAPILVGEPLRLGPTDTYAIAYRWTKTERWKFDRGTVRRKFRDGQ